jgi:hypothetical protein
MTLHQFRVQNRIIQATLFVLLISFSYLVFHSAQHAEFDHSCVICHADVHLSAPIAIASVDVVPTNIDAHLILVDISADISFVHSSVTDRAPPSFS